MCPKPYEAARQGPLKPQPDHYLIEQAGTEAPQSQCSPRPMTEPFAHDHRLLT
jgi:hypothetical protein